jgi:hypothetical protein
MLTSCPGTRWPKAVSGLRATAPPSWNTMMCERCDVILATWSTSTSIVRSSSGGTSQDFE